MKLPDHIDPLNTILGLSDNVNIWLGLQEVANAIPYDWVIID
jgi:hypothetical protein